MRARGGRLGGWRWEFGITPPATGSNLTAAHQRVAAPEGDAEPSPSPDPGTARAGACPLRVRPAEAGTCTAQGGEGSGRLKPEKTQTSPTAGGPDRLWNPHGELRHAAEARGDITVAAAGVTLA